MTPAEEYLRNTYHVEDNIIARVTEDGELDRLNNFAYTILKNLYNSLGKEMDSTTILNIISNYKAEFHQDDTNNRRSTKADS